MLQAKSRFQTFAIACLAGLLSLAPVTTVAAETKTESETQSETGKDTKQKAAFDEKMNTAVEKWNTLSEAQKDEIYNLLGNKTEAEIQAMQKLAEYGVLTKSDVEIFSSRMNNQLEKIKDSGDFPLFRQHYNKSSK